MKFLKPFRNSQAGGVNIAITLIFSILLGGLILQQSNVVGFKLAQSQRIKSSQAADNFIRLAIKRTQTLLSDQTIAVYEDGSTYPQLEVFRTIDNVTVHDGGSSSIDYLKFKFKNPRYIPAQAGESNSKNPEFIYVKVYMLEVHEDVVADEGLGNVRNTYIKARAVMEEPNQLSLTVNLKPYIRLYTQVSTGYDHTCAITGDGDVYCWGGNRWGQLGIGSASSTDVYPMPQKVSLGMTAQWVVASRYFTCALGTTTPGQDNGFEVLCWGLNDQGQLGSTKTLDASSEYKRVNPTSVNYANILADNIGLSSARFRASKLVAGDYHVCGLGHNFKGTYCWGRKEFAGITGGSASDAVQAPTSISIGSQPLNYKNIHVCEISASPNHTCIMSLTNTTDTCSSFDDMAPGKYFCWGEGSSGQLGNSASSDQRAPVSVSMPSGTIIWSPNMYAPADTKNWAQSNMMAFKDGTCTYYQVTVIGFPLARQLYCWGNYDTAISNENRPQDFCTWKFFGICLGWQYRRYVQQINRNINGEMYVVAKNYLESDGFVNGYIPRSDAETLRIYRYTTGFGKGEQLVTLPGLIQYPSFLNPLSMSSGGMSGTGHACVIADDRRLYCWGENGSGQLGLGDINGDGQFTSVDLNDKPMPSNGVLPANQKVTIIPRKLDFTH